MNTLITWLTTLLGKLQQPQLAQAPALAQVMQHETQSFAETLARTAESQVGVVEVGGNNRGPQVQAYQSATWLTGTGWAWCAAFVCWCVLVSIRAQGMTLNGWQRPRTAGAYDLENWANGAKPHGFNKAWHCFTSTPATPPQRGDIITFTWSHCGIVTGYDAKTLTIYTVEGNAGAHQRSDSTQDGVVAKKHHVTKCRRLIRKVA